MKNFENLLEG